MRTMKREPRRASGAEELAWGEVVEGGHGAAMTGLNGTAASKAPKLELGRAAIKAGWGQLERGHEGKDASTRN